MIDINWQFMRLSIEKRAFRILLMIGVLSIYFYYLFFISDFNTPRFNIYYSEVSGNSKFDLNYFIGKLPDNYEEIFHEDVFFRSDSMKLINIDNGFGNYIILSIDKTGKEYLLKNIIDSIDINAFNFLTKELKLSDEESIKGYYYYLLSNLKNNSYTLVKNRMDFENLFKERDKLLLDFFNRENKKYGKEVYKIIPINMQLDFSKYTFCHYKNNGLFKLSFVFDKEMNIIKVKKYHLGYIGSEYLFSNL